ncbi:MAG: A/G-specific adenine glycosylase [Deltaproteobacteria bacterium]|nr:A/G-specific adenine glycosylase [Deltaproteobacteria bacterium]
MKKFRGGDKLLHWYRTHRRDLPWRKTKDPYRIWVSEIMLQQTTVETVIPYYEKFLKRFPTIESLAVAEEDEVLRYWSGLGYYSRARNLLKAAKIIVDQMGARGRAVSLSNQARIWLCQSERIDWQQLPGIGRYTAGAIASIAFGERVPVVDGNVVRVLSRLFLIGSDPKSPAGQKIFWGLAALILPDRDVGDFNQALMELGATICTPRRPACLVCPVYDECEARKKGRQDLYPRLAKRAPAQKITMTAALIQKGDSLLMVRRPAKGILKEMWEFPMVEGGAERLVRDFGFRPIRALGSIRHSVLNKRLVITPYLCQMSRIPRMKSQWIHPEEIDRFPTSSMNRKILSKLL